MIDHLEDLDGQGPLWQQIRRALVKPIVEGHWMPDQKIPKEFEIIERYGAARMTVHRALRSLATEGYITRKRRFGTVVAAQPPERPVLEIWDIAAEVARLGAVYSFAILKRQILSGDNRKAAALEAGADDRVLHLTARHFSDEAPLQYEERLVNLSVAPAAADENFTGISPGSWLIHNIPWRQAEHTISAESAPATIAKLLDIPAQTACLVVERRTWNDAGLPITWVRLVHPGDKRRLVGRFQSDWG